MYLRLGPDEKELIDAPDNRKIQKDVPGEQKPPEDLEGYEDLSGSRPSTTGIPIRHCLLELLLLYYVC